MIILICNDDNMAQVVSKRAASNPSAPRLGPAELSRACPGQIYKLVNTCVSLSLSIYIYICIMLYCITLY